MSKSLGNTVGILAEESEVWERVRTAVTDPQRIKRSDAGRPDVCNVFTLHGHFTDKAKQAEIGSECRSAEIGCVECKKILSGNITDAFGPYRERAAYYRSKPDAVRSILVDGATRARAIAEETMIEVRDKMGLDWPGLFD